MSDVVVVINNEDHIETESKMKNKLFIKHRSCLCSLLDQTRLDSNFNAQSATGLGRAFAGDAVMADSAAHRQEQCHYYIEQPTLRRKYLYR